MSQFFKARKVEMSDDSELYEVVTPDGERVASSISSIEAQAAAARLNAVLKIWEGQSKDFVVNV